MGKAFLGDGAVEADDLPQEGQLAALDRIDEIDDRIERDGVGLLLRLLRGGSVLRLLLKQELSIAAKEGQPGVRPGDHRLGLVDTVRQLCLDPDLFLVVRQADVYFFLPDQLYRALFLLVTQAVEHKKLLFRGRAQRAERHGDIQANHAGAGDAHVHAVFENVAAHVDLDRDRLAAELMRGIGDREGDGCRLRAPQGGRNLGFQDGQILRNLLLFHGYS